MYFQKFYNVYQNKKREKNRSEAVDRNGRFQMQGGENWIFTEINQGKPILLGLSLAGNLVKPLLSLYIGMNGGSVATDSES